MTQARIRSGTDAKCENVKEYIHPTGMKISPSTNPAQNRGQKVEYLYSIIKGLTMYIWFPPIRFRTQNCGLTFHSLTPLEGICRTEHLHPPRLRTWEWSIVILTPALFPTTLTATIAITLSRGKSLKDAYCTPTRHYPSPRKPSTGLLEHHRPTVVLSDRSRPQLRGQAIRMGEWADSCMNGRR